MTVTPSRRGPTSRSIQAAETRERLVQAAIEQFSEHNFDDVAVTDIAKSAGVAHGLLFHYFGNKRGIYLEAMRTAARDLDSALAVSPDLPPGEQIREMFRGHLEYLAAHRGLASRLVSGGRGADPEAWAFFEEDRWHAIEWVAKVLGLNPDSRALRLMLRSSVAAIDEATVQWLEHGKPFTVEKMVEVFVEITIGNLRAAAHLDGRVKIQAAVEVLAGEPPKRAGASRRT